MNLGDFWVIWECFEGVFGVMFGWFGDDLGMIFGIVLIIYCIISPHPGGG